jgi:hypothetical protein
VSTTPPEAPDGDERTDRRGAPKGHSGNVAFEPTDEQRAQVLTYAKTFPENSNHRIAILIGVSRSTLEKYFRHELDLGRAQMLAAVGAQVINAALDAENKTAKGDRDLQKFILARLGGWSTKVEMGGKDGRPIETVDLSGMSPAALREYGRAAAVAQGLDPDEAVGPSLVDE